MIEFNSTADLLRHYAEVRKRTDPRPPKCVFPIRDLTPEPDPVPVTVIEPMPIPPPPVQVLLPPGNAFMMARIRLAVCRDYNVTREEFMSVRRTSRFALARHIAWYLASKLTTLSLPKIGVICGGRDHTTVLYGIRRIKRLMESDPVLAVQLAELEQELRG